MLDRRFQDAVSDAQIAYDSQQNARNLLLYLGALEGSGNAERGFELVRSHVENNPNDQRANLLYAERLITRDKTRAISAYESSIDAIPDNFLALNNLAYLYFEQGRLDEALPLAERAVSLQSKNPAAADTLAQIYIAKGELKRARTLYDRVVDDKTENDEVNTNYIKLLIQQGEQELAQRKAETAKWASPQAKQDALKLVSGS
jgi:tetratricopeptide (TPR) repeat protein